MLLEFPILFSEVYISYSHDKSKAILASSFSGTFKRASLNACLMYPGAVGGGKPEIRLFFCSHEEKFLKSIPAFLNVHTKVNLLAYL